MAAFITSAPLVRISFAPRTFNTLRRSADIAQAYAVIHDLTLSAGQVALAENSIAYDYASMSDPSGDLQSLQDAQSAFADALAASQSATLTSAERDKALARLDDSSKILNQLLGAPDKGIPDKVLESAKCVAVVPSMVKGGFIFGAEHGRGVATCRTAKGWLPGPWAVKRTPTRIGR